MSSGPAWDRSGSRRMPGTTDDRPESLGPDSTPAAAGPVPGISHSGGSVTALTYVILALDRFPAHRSGPGARQRASPRTRQVTSNPCPSDIRPVSAPGNGADRSPDRKLGWTGLRARLAMFSTGEA